MTGEYSANLPRQRGRPRNEFRAMLRAANPHWSERTFQTAWSAFAVFIGLFGDDGPAEWDKAVRKATRPNGSVNVSMLDRLATEAAIVWGQRMGSEARESPDPTAI